MEFSIQKIRRCGKSALRSHRREAARVVFFTIFLPFLLLLLLGVNLYHNIPGTFIGQNEKAVWIFAGIAAVVFLFFSSLAGCQALVSGNLSTRQTAHTVCFLLFFFFPSLWQSSRYRFASRLLPNCPSAVGNFTRKRHGSHFSCNVSLVRS